MKLQIGSILPGKSLACGANGSLQIVSGDSMNAPGRVGLGLFPPELIVQIKALTCELPATAPAPLGAGVSPIWADRFGDLVSQPPSVIAPYGVGACVIVPGFSLVTPSLPAKPDESWTSMSESGTAAAFKTTSSSGLPMRRPASRHAVAVIPPAWLHHRARPGLPESSYSRPPWVGRRGCRIARFKLTHCCFFSVLSGEFKPFLPLARTYKLPIRASRKIILRVDQEKMGQTANPGELRGEWEKNPRLQAKTLVCWP